ncbi:DUF664 domain-containing protein [Streptomyces sp. NPDC007905]|uniref:mycothiol transferase n=1 Tax=Streptomyces sp. NPDC007905 TaxID=3364788 RepID=UPI0036E9EECC
MAPHHRLTRSWPMEIRPTRRLPDVRHILIHVLIEVACHSGHLDAARELIDGTTWLDANPHTGWIRDRMGFAGFSLMTQRHG